MKTNGQGNPCPFVFWGSGSLLLLPAFQRLSIYSEQFATALHIFKRCVTCRKPKLTLQ